MPFAEIGQLLGSTFMMKVSQYGYLILSNYVLEDKADLLKMAQDGYLNLL